MISAPLDDPPPAVPSPPTVPKPWITWIFGGICVIGILMWLTGPALVLKIRNGIAEHYAQHGRTALENQDWSAAWAASGKARSWQVAHPPVLRLYADLLIAGRSDDLSLVQVLRSLETTPLATHEDRLLAGQIFISLGYLGEARTEYAKLSQKDPNAPESLELLASLYFAEGRRSEADRLLRRALAMKPDDPRAKFRLAMLDYQNTFPEVRNRAHQEIWSLIRSQTSVSLQAMEFLASQGSVTGIEALEMQKWVDTHPDCPPAVRYAVLSARLRARPQDRREVMAEEIQRLENQGVETLTPGLAWLLQEQQAEPVLSLLEDDDRHLQSSSLFDFYLQALAGLDRWAEVKQTLQTPGRLPISALALHVWKARLAHTFEKDINRTRHHLEAAITEIIGAPSENQARLVAQTAEQMNQWDLAARCYQEIAKQHPLARGTMMEKIHETDLRRRDTGAAIQSAKALAELHPENLAYRERVFYLQLVAGQELELTVRQLEQETEPTMPRSRLVQALGFYRFGNLTSLREVLPTAEQVEELPVGYRAVHAALLSACGQTGPAFRLAEKIPAGLLLPEELRLLQRAL